MDEQLARSLEQGYALAAANPRLARRLELEWGAAQRAAGRAGWAAAAISTLEAWLADAWMASAGKRVLLTAAQEQRLWEAIIATGATELLSPGAAARSAGIAWERLHAWRLPLDDPGWGATEDTEAFHGWARTFSEQCGHRGYITVAELPDAVAAAIARGELPAPRSLLLGFDQLTPQQQALAAAVNAAGGDLRQAEPEVVVPQAACTMAARDAEHELALAADWARRLLDGGAAGPVGVVVADLDQRLAAVERTFLAALHPGRPPDDTGPTAFHISIGPPLAQHPVAGSALLTLATWIDPPPAPAAEALRWLQSPFLRGAEREAQSRAAWARARRREQRAWWDWEEWQRRASGDTLLELTEMLRACRAARNAWPEQQPHGGWAASFGALLDAAGWPGERGLASAEHQAARAWASTTDEFRRLDQVSPEPIGAGEALRRLRGLAEARIFQPQAPQAPVEIMGWQEAAGERFAHLWIAGLDEATLPRPAAPHPFLPMDWQRHREMPGATAVTEAIRAARAWARLRVSAAQWTASWAARDGDLDLRPSPLLAGIDTTAAGDINRPAQAAEIEELDDSQAPPAAAAHGGSQLFTDQAACPFRAFAHARLGAEAAPRVPAGLAAATRGTLLHRALHAFWAAVNDSQALRAMSPEQRKAAARAAAAAAVDGEPHLQHEPVLAELEAARLARAILEWLQEELKPPNFQVVAREEKFETSFGGLDLHLTCDRLDRLEDNALRLLDYKSGKVSAGDWTPPRMKAPQLPLYAATHPQREQIAGVAFAQLKPGAMRLIPGTPTPAWTEDLERLAAAYRGGEAAVDPKHPKSTCDHCDLPSLCRIGDQAPALLEDAEEEGDDGD